MKEFYLKWLFILVITLFVSSSANCTSCLSCSISLPIKQVPVQINDTIQLTSTENCTRAQNYAWCIDYLPVDFYNILHGENISAPIFNETTCTSTLTLNIKPDTTLTGVPIYFAEVCNQFLTSEMISSGSVTDAKLIFLYIRDVVTVIINTDTVVSSCLSCSIDLPIKQVPVQINDTIQLTSTENCTRAQNYTWCINYTPLDFYSFLHGENISAPIVNEITCTSTLTLNIKPDTMLTGIPIYFAEVCNQFLASEVISSGSVTDAKLIFLYIRDVVTDTSTKTINRVTETSSVTIINRVTETSTVTLIDEVTETSTVIVNNTVTESVSPTVCLPRSQSTVNTTSHCANSNNGSNWVIPLLITVSVIPVLVIIAMVIAIIFLKIRNKNSKEAPVPPLLALELNQTIEDSVVCPLEEPPLTQNQVDCSSYERRIIDIVSRCDHQIAEAKLDAERRISNATTEADQRKTKSERKVQDAEMRMADTVKRAEARLQQASHQFNMRLADTVRSKEQCIQLANSRAQQAEQRVNELEMQWVVERREIQLTEQVLGGGGWGVVKVAKFRGIEVAAKSLYDELQYDYYRDLFIREMNMASRVRHPNLVQFIGATLEGDMIILAELMPTNLRTSLKENDCTQKNITSIGLDVAKALNYLHLMQPDPIIHRDISSANVLLEPLPHNHWRAKVTDYGSVNSIGQLNTVGPGSPVYSAPEANIPCLQSPKMDIFSFGILLIEMCTARFPEVSAHEQLIKSIQYPNFITLIRHCLDLEKENRPSASNIISELSKDNI